MMGKVSRERWIDSAKRRQVVKVASLRKQHLSKAFKKDPCTLSDIQCLLNINT